MKWYYNLKVGAKLLMGFVLVAVIASIIGVLGITNLKRT
jgi:methyl-accepting chemotaxis protein